MKDDKTIIKTIIEFIGYIEDDLSSCHDIEDYLENETIQRACSLSLIQIGEYVKRLSPEFRSKYNEIDWSEIAGLRDYLTHGYLKINFVQIWNDLTVDVPRLKEYLLEVLPKL